MVGSTERATSQLVQTVGLWRLDGVKTYLCRRHHIFGLGPCCLLGGRVIVIDASIGTAKLLPRGGGRRRLAIKPVSSAHGRLFVLNMRLDVIP